MEMADIETEEVKNLVSQRAVFIEMHKFPFSWSSFETFWNFEVEWSFNYVIMQL